MRFDRINSVVTDPEIEEGRKREEVVWLKRFTGNGEELRQTVAEERSDDGGIGSRVIDAVSQNSVSRRPQN